MNTPTSFGGLNPLPACAYEQRCKRYEDRVWKVTVGIDLLPLEVQHLVVSKIESCGISPISIDYVSNVSGTLSHVNISSYIPRQ